MKQISSLFLFLIFSQVILAQQKPDSLKKADSLKKLVSWSDTITGSQFNEGVISDPLQLILGKEPGAEVFKAGSDPNVPSSLMIRGTYQLYNETDPLYVIDGITGGDLFMVPPQEIESIKILKNLAETSFYGSEGTNGVILVTTKNGNKNKRLSVNFNTAVSLGQTRGLTDLFTADQMREKAQTHPDAGFIDGGATTNWQDELFRTTVSQSYQLALGGTLKNTNYRVSFNHIDQPGNIMASSRNITGGSVKLMQTGFQKKLQVSGLISYYLTKSHFLSYSSGKTGENPFYQLFTQNPTDPVYTADGSSYFQGNRYYQDYNPLALINRIDNEGKTEQFSAMLDATLDIWKGLGIKISGSYFDNKTSTLYNRPNDAYPEATTLTMDGSDKYSRTNLLAGLTFKRTFAKKHAFDLFAGYMYRSLAKENESLTYYQYPTPQGYFLEKINYMDYGLRANLNYHFRQKYNVSIILNQEHYESHVTPEYNSNTLPWGQWAFYPGITASWEINREGFMKNCKHVSTLILKGSYGAAGARPKSDYISVDNPGYENKELEIEKTVEFTAGLDAGFLRNRIMFGIEYYNRLANNVLSRVPLAVPPNRVPYSYLSGMKLNNSGIELKLMSLVINKKMFNWNSILCFSKNKNKVISINGDQPISSGMIDYIPAISNTAYILTTTSGNSILAYNLPVFLSYDHYGQPVYESKNGGYTSSVDDARRQINDQVFPDYILSWTNSFSLFKCIDLSLMFRYVSGHRIFNGTRMYLSDPNYYLSKNTLPEAETNVDAGVIIIPLCDMYLENASYLRLENLSVGYTFVPKESKWKGSLRVYLAIDNVFTITGYSGLDPEFNYNSPGLDYFNTYPKSRTYTLGINLEI
jgi:iron complex outermembrane receptor protein